MYLAKSRVTVELEDIGPVLFERSLRAQHININVKPQSGVRVAVPKGISFRKAINFAKSKTSWIQRHQKRLKTLLEKKTQIGEVSNVPAAKELLRNRLGELAKQYGYTFNRVFIRQQKTRWGSCSAKNNISLNAKLTSLPKELMDYVILHELVHTRVKNHSKDFWNTLDKYVKNSKKIDKKLKKYSL